MRKHQSLYFEIILFGCIAGLVTACGSSMDVTSVDTESMTSIGVEDASLDEAESQQPESENSESSSASFAPGPIEKQFFDNTTSLLEVSVFQKSLEGASIFIEHVQTEPSLIDERLLPYIQEIDSLAAFYFGVVSPSGNLLNEIPSCEFGFGENEFNYIAKSTKLSGETVTLINGNLCGIVPDLTFEKIDGQVPFDSISVMKKVLACTNTDSCDQLDLVF